MQDMNIQNMWKHHHVFLSFCYSLSWPRERYYLHVYFSISVCSFEDIKMFLSPKKNEGKKALYFSVAVNCFAFVILVALSLLCTFSSVAASFCASLAIKQQNFPEKQC